MLLVDQIVEALSRTIVVKIQDAYRDLTARTRPRGKSQRLTFPLSSVTTPTTVAFLVSILEKKS